MEMNDRIKAIAERCETALSFAKDCDRTNNGCQVPQVLKLLEHDIPYLLTEIDRLNAELFGKTEQLEAAKSELLQKTQQLAASKRREQAAVEDLCVAIKVGWLCNFCANGQCFNHNGKGQCIPIWRGPQEGGRVRMKCESCKKYEDCKSSGTLTWPCGAYRPDTITNFDRLRAMSDEDLARFLWEQNGSNRYWKSVDMYLEWGRSPYKEESHE